MTNNRLITHEVGNLRGFSTDSIFMRPPNVATDAINLQRAPDNTLQLRRGYQCQIGQIGGMGIGTFDNPAIDAINTVCVGTDGFLYQKLEKQIYLYYNGQITGAISGVTNVGGFVNIQSTAHGLSTGAQIIIRNTSGAPQLNIPNLLNSPTFRINFFTITVVDANNFILDGILYADLSPAYISGGSWSIYFADSRYLTLNIFVDPLNIFSNTNQSINCDFIVNKSAQINGNQNLVNTIVVQFGNDLITGNVVQFTDINGVIQQRNVVGSSSTSITIDGAPVSVLSGFYINQLVQLAFGKGFDVVSPYYISNFIADATSLTNGVSGLSIAVNGDTNLPAAFIQILEPVIIPSGTIYTLDYWYWNQINFTFSPPLPGSANPIYQNSQSFENASMAAYDDVIYIANGWDFPQKYDGQTVYRAGLPQGVRPFPITDIAFQSQPFSTGNQYQYATTYEQIDAQGHILEGQLSAITDYEAGTTTTASSVTLTNLMASKGNNWNTNFALATGGTATVYGPDVNNNYYDLVAVNVGYTLKIGDSAYYGDITAAEITAATTPDPGLTIPVTAGHAVVPGDTIYFFDTSNEEHQRVVVSTTTTSVTIEGVPVSVSAGSPNILDFKTGLVFGNVAIIDGDQTSVGTPPANVILVKTGHSIEVNDVVQFVDSQNNLQRRNVTNVNGDGVHITIDQTPVSLKNLFLIASTNQRTNAINIQRQNSGGATLSPMGGTAPFFVSNAISNNLRINIYRTLLGQTLGTDGSIYLLASIPNDGSGAAVQQYIDGLPDTEVGNASDEDPLYPPNPPPISKYLVAFGTQMFYAGGERGNPENSDRVFFSATSGIAPNPEVVPQPAFLFNVPNVDDEITGIGVSGSTLIVTKNNSLWGSTGNFFKPELAGQIQVFQIAKGSNIGCAAHASIASVGSLMYFAHTNGVYALTENQLFPTDEDGNPIPISKPIDQVFRQENYLPWKKLVLKRSVACNYTKENQYLLFIPCEDTQATIRTANTNSILLAYDYGDKNWYKWENMNAAGGIFVSDDDLYFQERRYSGVNGNTANLYKQHRFYRLVDHADHAGAEKAVWTSSWVDLGQPQVRKKFSRCLLLMDRLSELYQYNNDVMTFSTYLDRIPNLQNTIAVVEQVDNIRNAGWGSPWGWNYWSGIQDTFISVPLKQGTSAKSIQVGFVIEGINMDIRLAGFQLEIIPENRMTIAR